VKPAAPAYKPPKLKPRVQAAVDACEFDFLVPWSKTLYRTDEVAECLGRDPAYVRALISAGRLDAHCDSALGDRKSSRVTRRSLIMYLAETANYEQADMVPRFEAVLKTMRPHHLKQIAAWIQKRLPAIEQK
jgi:hypothetical protein